MSSGLCNPQIVSTSPNLNPAFPVIIESPALPSGTMGTGASALYPVEKVSNIEMYIVIMPWKEAPVILQNILIPSKYVLCRPVFQTSGYLTGQEAEDLAKKLSMKFFLAIQEPPLAKSIPWKTIPSQKGTSLMLEMVKAK